MRDKGARHLDRVWLYVCWTDLHARCGVTMVRSYIVTSATHTVDRSSTLCQPTLCVNSIRSGSPPLLCGCRTTVDYSRLWYVQANHVCWAGRPLHCRWLE